MFKFSFSLSSKAERDETCILFNRLLQDFWQLLFESRLVPSPEIYQFHAFIRKVNRKGREQIRCIVISDKRIYNVKFKPGDPDPKKKIVRVCIILFYFCNH